MTIINYFNLQGKILKRYVVDAGFPAFVCYPAIIILYSFLYYLLTQSPTWGASLLFIANFQYLFSLSGFKRNEFLKSVFPITLYYQVRILENIVMSLGSLTIFVSTGNYLMAFALLMSCILFIFTSTISFWKRSIPTPFTKKPFEFIIGFRKSWLSLLLLYVVSIIAVGVGNLNLLLFCMFCICLCCTFYYQAPEPLLIHWQQNRKPAAFLRYKIRRGIIQLSLLVWPLFFLVAISFPTDLYKAFIVWLLGLTLIPFIISLKYAVFPRAISIPEGTIISLCLIFYPLIIAVVPYYYFKAVNNLKQKL